MLDLCIALVGVFLDLFSTGCGGLSNAGLTVRADGFLLGEQFVAFGFDGSQFSVGLPKLAGVFALKLINLLSLVTQEKKCQCGDGCNASKAQKPSL